MAVLNTLNNIIKQKKLIENLIKQTFTSLALSTIYWLEKEFSLYNIIRVFTSEQEWILATQKSVVFITVNALLWSLQNDLDKTYSHL